MMTCVSERSGIASTVMFRMDQSPASVAIPTIRNTTNLLWAQRSMILLIMLVLSRFCLMLQVVHPGHTHPADCRFQFAFGVDEEIARRHDPLAGLQAAEDNEPVIDLGSKLDLAS